MGKHTRQSSTPRRNWRRGIETMRFDQLEARALMAVGGGLPDLTAVGFSTDQAVDWGASVRVVGAIANVGRAKTTAPTSVVIEARSLDDTSNTNIPLGLIEVPANLAPNTQFTFDQILILPPAPPSGSTGSPGVLIRMNIDPRNRVVESDETNNRGLGDGIDAVAAATVPPLRAELIGQALTATPGLSSWGQPISVSSTVTNLGPDATPQTRARIVLSPNGQTPGGPEDMTIAEFTVPALAAQQSIDQVQTITLPINPTVALQASSTQTISIALDSDFATNQYAPHVARMGWGLDQNLVQISTGLQLSPAASNTLPNLAPATLQVPTSPLTWGEAFQVVAKLANTGAAASGPVRARFLLQDASTPQGVSIFLADTIIENLAAGETRDLFQTLKLPSRLPNGNFPDRALTGQIRVVLDPEGTITEASESDNTMISNQIGLKVYSYPTPPAVTKTTAAAAAAARAKARAAKLHTVAKATPKTPVVARQIASTKSPNSTKTANTHILPN